ncbi:MAG: hypothetical protein ABS47_21060 [Devosia sp. SCN 66-27]|nr:MAG: hypothetical protein ABS47_21060 [Devosia sp. SCN 66-27]
MNVSIGLAIGLLSVWPMLAGTATAAGPQPSAVVELFTSQGCSSCPPANANLIELSRQPGVLVLSFAVTYWDYLGWKDSFGKEEFTDRQRVYEPPLRQRRPYTPQMVVNGRATVVGNDLDQVQQLIASTPSPAGPPVSLSASAVRIGAGAVSAEADVWLVRYDPDVVEVPVGRGENTGRTLPHTHVVHSLDRLGTWSGAELSLTFGPAANGLRTAVLVQEPNGGPILSVATD